MFDEENVFQVIGFLPSVLFLYWVVHLGYLSNNQVWPWTYTTNTTTSTTAASRSGGNTAAADTNYNTKSTITSTFSINNSKNKTISTLLMNLIQ